jgi:SulP family sulfate permease
MVLAPGMGFVDLPGAEMLAQEARRRKALGGGLYFHRMQQPVRETLEKAGYLRDIGTANLFVMGEDVMASLYPRLDPEICRGCKLRVFNQCHARLPNGEPRVDPSPAPPAAAPPAVAAGTATPEPSRLSDHRARRGSG